MFKCWVPHLELHTEENVGVVKDQGGFYQISPLKVRVMATVGMQILGRVLL